MSDTTTIGTLLINDALPEGMRRKQHVLDKKGVHALFQELATNHPDRYKQVLDELSQVGKTAAWTDGVTVSLAALRDSPARERVMGPVRDAVRGILEDDDLTDDERREALIAALLPVAGGLQDALMDEARAEGNPFAVQIDSGARGNKGSFASIRGADLLATDQHDRFIPIPLLHSYAQGFSPAEYFAASYGQRKGMLGVKVATADAGFLTKQLVNAAHRQVITHDEPTATRLPVGLPVETSDKDNIGAVLAVETSGHPAGTVITDEILQDMQDDHDEILVHSPMTELSEDGGLSTWAAGRRTREGLHQIGDNIGIPAAQSLGERLSQGTLDAKHSAGVSDRVSRAGFEYLNRLIQAPEHFPEAGPLAEADGLVESIKDAPQGGNIITVGGTEYYASPELEIIVAVGDEVEQGDDLTDGAPHPAQLVRLRGMGEARRTYLTYMTEALRNSNLPAHRRNVESVVAGLLNWARVTDPDGIDDNIYDDVVPFGRLTAHYTPRANSQELPLSKLRGTYLEEPVLHYTPGTRVNSRVIDALKRHNIKSVYANTEEPGFEPHMVRGILGVYHDPDWRVRQAGFYTSRAFDRSLHRGLTSDTASTSFVPALAEATHFGKGLSTTGTYGPARPATDRALAMP